MLLIQRYCVIKSSRLLTVFVGMACLALTSLAVAETCEGDQHVIPDAAMLPSVQSLATAGNAHAQAQMGAAYLRGQGVELNTDKALSLLEKSAAAGDSEGQYLLGTYYIINGKTHKDFQKAVSWLQKSADQGCLPALLYQGLSTKEGKGVPKNNEDGLRMITKAAEAGYPQAQLRLGIILITGDGVSKDTKAGFNWVKRAADAGDSAAQLALANLYLIGKGTKINTEAAISLLEKVYAKNDNQAPTAAYMLGWTYMEGEGVPVDTVKAFSWMLIAANGQISDSQERLKILLEQLPKQKLATACSVYMDPYFSSNNAKEYTHMNRDETVVVLNVRKTLYEVYFPDQPMVGYIPRQCLDSAKTKGDGEIKK